MAVVSAIVPAAGLSTRIGGPNKMLLPYGGLTVVGTVARTLLSCDLDVVVVTGRDASLVSEAVEPVRTVFNERYREGLGTSIACGVAACPPDHGYLIALGDMPELSPEVVRLLVAQAEPQAILAPVYAQEPDRPGHPVLFGSSYREALLALHGDEGARSIVQANRAHLRLVKVAGNLPDIDSLEP